MGPLGRRIDRSADLDTGHHGPATGERLVDSAVQRLLTGVREAMGMSLTGDGDTNCFRLVHGEGDGLSGLVVDFYAGMAGGAKPTLGACTRLGHTWKQACARHWALPWN